MVDSSDDEEEGHVEEEERDIAFDRYI